MTDKIFVKDIAAKQFLKITYILFFIQCLFPPIVLIGLTMAYVGRNNSETSSYTRSHFQMLINVFWVSFIMGIIGFICCFFIIGYFILIGVIIWQVYCYASGFLKMLNEEPVKQ